MSSELSEIAETVLFGRTLADKLFAPEIFTDTEPGVAIAAPERPGRPAGLELSERGGPAGPPTQRSAENPIPTLHAFANHELMAVELMALVLLRFPQAPRRFRAGLAATLRDEQRHLASYIDRIAALGGSFGERPLGSSFWNVLRDVADPRQFVATMSLGFEQANLDFAVHYARVFRAVGDEDSAKLLEAVLADEIRHVRHGARWFARFSGGSLDWREWRASLPSGIGPSSARGAEFRREERIAAGLPLAYIDRLEATFGARGKPPRIHVFNADCEGELIGREPNAIVKKVQRDLELVPGYLASATDVVVASREPSLEFSRPLRALGIPFPEVLVVSPEEDLEQGLSRAFAKRSHRGVHPWGSSARMDALAQPLQARSSDLLPAVDAKLQRRWASKAYAAEMSRHLRDEGVDQGPDLLPEVVGNMDALVSTTERLRADGIEVVWKSDLASAGRGNRRPSTPISARDRAFARAQFATTGVVVLGPWFTKIADLSIHLTIGSGAVRVDGATRFLTDGLGRFLGVQLGHPLRAAPSSVHRLFEGLGGFAKVVARWGAAIGASLVGEGFEGEASADLLIHGSMPAPRLAPLIEVNPRRTMGRVGLRWAGYVQTRRRAYWLQISRRSLDRHGISDFAELQHRLEGPFSIECGRLQDGIVFTTPAETAESLVTLVAVGEGLERLRAVLPDALSALDWPRAPTAES